MYLRLDPIASGKYIDIFVHTFTTCLLCKILNTLEKNVNFWKFLSFKMSPKEQTKGHRKLENAEG